MRLWCDRIFSNHSVTNLLLSLSLKEFWNLVYIWCSYDKNLSLSVFLDNSDLTRTAYDDDDDDDYYYYWY